MILIIPGMNSCSPALELVRKEGLPFHICDLLRKDSQIAYKINLGLCKNFVDYFEPSIIIGKSYGAWIAGESIHKKTPKVLFSTPLKNRNKTYGFPKLKEKNTILIFGKNDLHFSESLLSKNRQKYKNSYILPGDHSLRPITSRTLEKIKKKIINNFGKENSLNYINTEFNHKKKNAKVDIINNTNYYEKAPLGYIKRYLNSDIKKFVDNINGPITDIVKRKIKTRKIHVYQSNMVNPSKMNPLVKDCVATGGLGIALSRKEAIQKCIYEALERYSLSLSYMEFIKMKYKEIPRILRPKKEDLSFYNKKQKEKHKILDPKKEKIKWTPITNALNEEKILYPLSLITPSNIGEFIKETTSTGTAIGTTKEKALTNGINEAIERNSLMLWFYNSKNVKAKKLRKPTLSKKSKKIVDHLSKEGFRFNFFLIKFLKFGTIFAIADNGKKVCFGSASGNLENSIEKSLYEIIIMYFFTDTLKKISPKNKKDIVNLPQHMLYYQNRKNFSALLNYLNKITKSRFSYEDRDMNFNNIVKCLQNKDFEVFYKEVTAPDLKPYNLHVYKVIIPKFLDIIKRHDLSWKKHPSMKDIIIPALPTPFA